jgi:hypothetical protein
VDNGQRELRAAVEARWHAFRSAASSRTSTPHLRGAPPQTAE